MLSMVYLLNVALTVHPADHVSILLFKQEGILRAHSHSSQAV